MVDRQPSRIYDSYAAIYERIGQRAFAQEQARRTLDWLASAYGKRLRVLDLACGTGAAALVFAAAGHEVVGVDRSPAMLDLARAKGIGANGAVSLLLQDMRALDIASLGGPASFDLVTCFFDSLNYLSEDGDLRRVCMAVGALLRPEGLFIFDLHTPAELARWDLRDEVVCDDEDLLVYNRLAYDDRSMRATGRVVWFERRGNRWWRGEETHTERPWDAAAIKGALHAGGMRLLAALTPDGAPVTEQTGRVVYYAQRVTKDTSHNP